MHTTLSVHDILSLQKMVDALGKHVVLIDCNDDEQRGTLRHIVIGPDNFAFPSRGDIRDHFVRITTDKGWDMTLPVARFISHPDHWMVG